MRWCAGIGEEGKAGWCCASTYIYIYIYMYTNNTHIHYIYIYIYICIVRQVCAWCHASVGSHSLPALPTQFSTFFLSLSLSLLSLSLSPSLSFSFSLYLSLSISRECGFSPPSFAHAVRRQTEHVGIAYMLYMYIYIYTYVHIMIMILLPLL